MLRVDSEAMTAECSREHCSPREYSEYRVGIDCQYRDSRKSRQKAQNGEKHGKLLWKSQKSRHQIRGPKTIMQSTASIDDHHYAVQGFHL